MDSFAILSGDSCLNRNTNYLLFMYFLFNIVFLIFKFRSIHEKRVYSLKPAARCRGSFVCVFFSLPFLLHSGPSLRVYTTQRVYLEPFPLQKNQRDCLCRPHIVVLVVQNSFPTHQSRCPHTHARVVAAVLRKK